MKRQHEDKQDPAIDKGKARLSRFKTVIQGSRVAPAQHMPSKNTAAPTAAAALPTAPEAERKKITITPRVWVDGKVSDKPYGEAVKQIWNTASETPTAPKPAPKPAPTPTAPVSAPPPEAKLVADLKGNGVNTKTFIENMESLSQCLQRGEASARKTTWVETVDLLFGAVPKDKLYWQAELKKAEKMQAYAYELEAVATQELVLIEQSEGPSAAITENQADKT